jgi:isopentenyl phosphate kinase
MSHLVVIKFGGSLITNKDKPLTARPAAIRTLSKGFAEVQRSMPGTHFLLGNGAGSFAHFSAHQYGLRDGATTVEQLYGMCVTHSSVQELNTLMAKALQHERVPAFSLAPSSFLFCDEKAVISAHLQPVRQLLATGCVPLVYGDTILDRTRGTTILATEMILLACIRALRTEYKRITVVYMMSADGVLDNDGNIIPELTPNALITVTSAQRHDVTGGISGKVEAARQAAALADEVFIIGGNAQQLHDVLDGKPTGTKVLA